MAGPDMDTEKTAGQVESTQPPPDTDTDTTAGTTARVEPESHGNEEHYLVTWDSDSDPTNPMNWTTLKRWSHIIYISLLTFVTGLVSSMLAPAVPDVMISFNSNDEALSSFVLSVYVIGFAIGPLLAAPLSEMYGRAVVYHVSNVFFLACTMGCALSVNLSMFIAFRFLSGLVGVVSLALGGSSIGDVMPPDSASLGKAMSVWGFGSLIGPVFAPVAGGYISQYVGWRWIFWVVVIAVRATP